MIQFQVLLRCPRGQFDETQTFRALFVVETQGHQVHESVRMGQTLQVATKGYDRYQTYLIQILTLILDQRFDDQDVLDLVR